MTLFSRALVTAGLIISAAFSSANAADRETLYQYSTVNSLLAGLYDGNMTVGALTSHGDFGLGTFNGLDGEMIVLDGTVYQARSGGTTVAAPASTGVPFTSVTFFDADKSVPLPAGFTLEALEEFLDLLAPNQNVYQAIRVDGLFRNVKLRTAPRQSTPYAPLAQVIEQQEVFELSDTSGTLVGIRAPKYLTGLNVPGYHFHFVTADRTRGGHVFGISASSGTIQIDHTAQFTVALPNSRQFAALDLNQIREGDMQKVEKAQAQARRAAPLQPATPSYTAPNYATPRHSEPISAPVYARPPAPYITPTRPPLAVATPSVPTYAVTPPVQPIPAQPAPVQIQPIVVATEATPPAEEKEKSKAPWSFLFECQDNALPENMRMRNQRHKAARRPANKAVHCP